MKRIALQLLATLMSASALALGTAGILPDCPAKDLLKKKCIHTATGGLLPLSYGTATALLDNENLLKTIQSEYAHSVSRNGKVLFPVIKSAPGKYHYTNASGQRTDIEELYRRSSGDGTFDIILQASGKRFFGRYDVIIHIQILDASDIGVAYTVQLYTYPHNRTWRFLARRTGTIERYFNKNTANIQWVAQQIGTSLAERSAFKTAWNQEVTQSDPVLARPFIQTPEPTSPASL
jgi:hypothetical protein